MSSRSGAVLINDNVINIKRGQDNHDIPVTIAVPGAVFTEHYTQTLLIDSSYFSHGLADLLTKMWCRSSKTGTEVSFKT